MALRAEGSKRAPALLLLLAATATLTVCTRQVQAYKYLEGALIETMDMTPFIGNDREGHVCYEADVLYYAERGDIQSDKTDSPKKCQQKCEARHDCHFWSWDSITNDCLEMDVNAVYFRERSVRSQGFISGPKKCTMPHPMRCYEKGVAFLGHSVKHVSGVASAFNCHEECLKETNCIYWTWHGDRRECTLSKISALEGWTQDNSTIHDISGMRSCGPCVELGVDYRGHDVERISNEKVPVAEECRRRCMRHAGCFFWTWVRSHKGCYLKGFEALDGRLKDELTVDMVSGSKFCPMDRQLRMQLMTNVPWASRDFFRHSRAPCYEEGIRYVSTPLTTIQNFSVKCAHDCHVSCRKSARCTHWTFDTASYECQLKNDPVLKKKREDNKISGSKECPCPDEERDLAPL